MTKQYSLDQSTWYNYDGSITVSQNGKVYVRSGAGIVADSVPENEYQECLNKAAAVFRALKDAEGLCDDSAD